MDRPVFDTSGFYFHDAAVQTKGVDDPAKQRSDRRISLSDNIRTMPSYLAGFRGSSITGLDVSAIKTIQVRERLKVQIRGEVVNALNTVQFGDPSMDPTKASFGIVSSQDNYPRQMQVSVKVGF